MSLRPFTPAVLALAVGCGGSSGGPLPATPAVSPVAGPAPAGAFPRVVVGPGAGALVVATRSVGDGHALVLHALAPEESARASDAPLAWGSAVVLATGPDWFVNWADTPALGPAGERFTWLARSGSGTYDYGVWTATAPGADGRLLHDDEGPGEHGFVSLAGDHAVWLDGRATREGGAMQLRARAVAAPDGGPSLGPEVLLDDRVCDCCPTALAATAGGTLVAAYRDRTGDEVRDISIVRRPPGGAWTSPTPPHVDGWTVAGCPVNGPALAARGEALALAWYTEGGGPAVFVTFSPDAGATFGPRLRVDGGAPLGQVDVGFTGAGDAVVTWLEGAADGSGRWRARRVAPSGAASDATLVARAPAARSAGRLRLAELADGSLAAAWTDVEHRTLAAARLR